MESPDVGVCDRCYGHHWLVWMEKAPYGTWKNTAVKACEACNCDGELPPPDYHGYIGQRNQMVVGD